MLPPNPMPMVGRSSGSVAATATFPNSARGLRQTEGDGSLSPQLFSAREGQRSRGKELADALSCAEHRLSSHGRSMFAATAAGGIVKTTGASVLQPATSSPSPTVDAPLSSFARGSLAARGQDSGPAGHPSASPSPKPSSSEGLSSRLAGRGSRLIQSDSSQRRSVHDSRKDRTPGASPECTDRGNMSEARTSSAGSGSSGTRASNIEPLKTLDALLKPLVGASGNSTVEPSVREVQDKEVLPQGQRIRCSTRSSASAPPGAPMLPQSSKRPKEIDTSAYELPTVPDSPSEAAGNAASNTPTRKESTMGRALSTTSSIHSNRPSLTTCYVNFDKFDLQIENGRAPTKIESWEQIAPLVSDRDVGILQAAEWYSWAAPMKFQAVAIPCIIQACRNKEEAKSYTLLQAVSGLGKTSSVALALLASVRREVASLQFIVLALTGVKEMEEYISSWSILFDVKVAYFNSAEVPEELDEDVESAQGAQIIIGHPSHVCAVIQASQEKLALQTMEVLLMDDASGIISQGLVPKVCEINQICSLFTARPLRYVVVSGFVEREAKPALRALKSSLMSKKNMFDVSAQVGRIRKFVKHYLIRGKPEDWVKSLIKLCSMIYIPRAVIFCDDEPRFQDLKKKFSSQAGLHGEDGRKLSFAIMDSQDQSPDQRRNNLSSFCKEQQDFLLTRSEPNIFQSSLPRVFWIIHFGIDSSNLSWYGCRLLCLDSRLRQQKDKESPKHDGVSILFLPPEKQDKEKVNMCVPKIEKMFKIGFEGLPFGDI